MKEKFPFGLPSPRHQSGARLSSLTPPPPGTPHLGCNLAIAITTTSNAPLAGIAGSADRAARRIICCMAHNTHQSNMSVTRHICCTALCLHIAV